MSIYDKFITKEDLVFDIGANIGDKAALFVELTGPKGLVVAVEPQRICIDYLKERFNNLELMVVGHAVGQSAGYGVIRRSKDLS